MKNSKVIRTNYLIALGLLLIAIGLSALIYGILDSRPKVYHTDSLSSPGMDNAFTTMFIVIPVVGFLTLVFAVRVFITTLKLPSRRLKAINAFSFFWVPIALLLTNGGIKMIQTIRVTSVARTIPHVIQDIPSEHEYYLHSFVQNDTLYFALGTPARTEEEYINARQVFSSLDSSAALHRSYFRIDRIESFALVGSRIVPIKNEKILQSSGDKMVFTEQSLGKRVLGCSDTQHKIHYLYDEETEKITRFPPQYGYSLNFGPCGYDHPKPIGTKQDFKILNSTKGYFTRVSYKSMSGVYFKSFVNKNDDLFLRIEGRKREVLVVDHGLKLLDRRNFELYDNKLLIIGGGKLVSIDLKDI